MLELETQLRELTTLSPPTTEPLSADELRRRAGRGITSALRRRSNRSTRPSASCGTRWRPFPNVSGWRWPCATWPT